MNPCDEEKARIFDEGFKLGTQFERAKWYWSARNYAALIVMGWPRERPERPKNPYKKEA